MRDFTLTKETESHVYHCLRGSRVLTDAQEAAYRLAGFGWIASLSDSIQHIASMLGGKEQSLQNL